MVCVINFKSAKNLQFQLRWCQVQGEVSKERVLRAPKTHEIIVSINVTVPNHTDKICTMNR